MFTQSIPYALRAINPESIPFYRKSRPTNVERLSINHAKFQPGLGFNHPKPSIKNVSASEIYSAASSVAGFSRAAAFCLGLTRLRAWMVSTSTSKPRS